MIVSPVEIKQKQGANKYALTIAVSKRARELNSGQSSVIESSGSKPVTNAIEEFLAGELQIVNDES